jgi:hypothetical protein
MLKNVIEVRTVTCSLETMNSSVLFFGILRKNLIITIEMNFIHINENQSATAKSLLQCKTEPLVIGFWLLVFGKIFRTIAFVFTNI